MILQKDMIKSSSALKRQKKDEREAYAKSASENSVEVCQSDLHNEIRI